MLIKCVLTAAEFRANTWSVIVAKVAVCSKVEIMLLFIHCLFLLPFYVGVLC